LPFPTLEQRSLVGGFAADLVSGPVYNPFGVVSQVQMVADSRYGEHRYSNGLQTTRSILAEQGWRALFRGTLLTVILAPLTGAWWLVYELLKHRAYNVVACASPSLVFIIPPEVRRRIPECCTSTTDNLLVNCSVGATASMVISLLLNPFYVLRLRLQVDKNIGYARFPSFVIMKSVLRREGIQAFFKGLHTNLFMAAVGGCAFGMTYEGAKQFSDIT
ncbi:carrier protein, partial [Trypanosoma grayi]|uniref:carrier protein n=1 Tax=Trypanosoma grayi TaxID=71804 RepID=UPI0004F3F132